MFPYGNGFDTINHRESHIDRSKISDFIIVNETQVKVGHHYFWIWIVIKSDGKTILGNYPTSERNMLVAEQFIQSL